jgi:hypothetical protein
MHFRRTVTREKNGGYASRMSRQENHEQSRPSSTQETDGQKSVPLYGLSSPGTKTKPTILHWWQAGSALVESSPRRRRHTITQSSRNFAPRRCTHQPRSELPNIAREQRSFQVGGSVTLGSLRTSRNDGSVRPPLPCLPSEIRKTAPLECMPRACRECGHRIGPLGLLPHICRDENRGAVRLSDDRLGGIHSL